MSEEATERLNLLMKDYKEGAERLARMGFNSKVLDLESSRVEEKLIPEGEEAQIEALVRNKATNSAGGMFKIGLHVVNSRVMLEANRKITEMEIEAKKKKEEKQTQDMEKKEETAIYAYDTHGNETEVK